MESPHQDKARPLSQAHCVQEAHTRRCCVENGSAAEKKIKGHHSQNLEAMGTPRIGCSLGKVVDARPGAAEDEGGMRQGADAHDDEAGVHELRQLARGYGGKEEAPDDRRQAEQSEPGRSTGLLGGECVPSAATRGNQESNRMSVDAHDDGRGVSEVVRAQPGAAEGSRGMQEGIAGACEAGAEESVECMGGGQVPEAEIASGLRPDHIALDAKVISFSLRGLAFTSCESGDIIGSRVLASCMRIRKNHAMTPDKGIRDASGALS